MVHGTLFGANLLFIHVMLVSRMKTIQERKDLYVKKMKVWERYRHEVAHSVHHKGHPHNHNNNHTNSQHSSSKSKSKSKQVYQMKSISLGSLREKGGEIKVAEEEEKNSTSTTDTDRSNHTHRSSTSSMTSSMSDRVAIQTVYCWSILQTYCIYAKFMARKYIFQRPAVFIHFLYLFVFRMLCYYEIDFSKMSFNQQVKEGEEEVLSSLDGNIFVWLMAGGILYGSFMQIGSSIAEVRAEERMISDAKRRARAKEAALEDSESGSGTTPSEASSDIISNLASSNSNDSLNDASRRNQRRRRGGGRSRRDGNINAPKDKKQHVLGGGGHDAMDPVVVGNSIGGGALARHLLDSDYTARFMQRWTVIVLFQLFVFMSAFFSPSGPPNYFPTVAIDMLVLSLVMESLLGTIKRRSFTAWAGKYHVVGALAFCIPLIFVCMWEFVGMVLGSFQNTGQIHMQNSGTVGSNFLVRGSNSNGWWWGNDQVIVIFISSFCWLGICASLNLLPSFIRWLGIRGPKAPLWLEDLLIDTDGHVPRPRNGNEFRELCATNSFIDVHQSLFLLFVLHLLCLFYSFLSFYSYFYSFSFSSSSSSSSLFSSTSSVLWFARVFA